MIRLILGVLAVLHGLVHLLYAGHSLRAFEMQPGMTWPDGSWAFARSIGDTATRQIVAVALVMAAVAFVAAGVTIIAAKEWSHTATIVAAVISSAVYILCWNGTLAKLGDQGMYGVLINAALAVAMIIARRPDVVA